MVCYFLGQGRTISSVLVVNTYRRLCDVIFCYFPGQGRAIAAAARPRGARPLRRRRDRRRAPPALPRLPPAPDRPDRLLQPGCRAAQDSQGAARCRRPTQRRGARAGALSLSLSRSLSIYIYIYTYIYVHIYIYTHNHTHTAVLHKMAKAPRGAAAPRSDAALVQVRSMLYVCTLLFF